MAVFDYKVLSKDGKEKKGSIEAQSKEQAIEQIKSNGMIVLHIEEQSALNKDINIGFGRKKVKAKELMMFCKQFKSILNAGINIVETLDMLASQTSNKRFSAAILDVKTNVEKGDTLSNAMRKQKDYFPPMLLNMVEAGELSGSLELSLERMSVQFHKDDRLSKQVKKAMTYPMVILCVALGVLVIMMVAVIPRFASMFEDMGSELPGITKALLNISGFLMNKWYIVIAIVIIIFIAFKIFTRSEQGKKFFANLALKAPIISPLVQKIASARFARTLSTLTGAGVSLMAALEITSKVMGNIILEERIIYAKEQVERGVQLSKPLKESGLFPNMLVQMVKIGEETGQMEEMLDKVADFYDEEVESAVDQFTALLEPMVIVLVAIIVGVIVGAIMAPMAQMYRATDTL